MMGVQLHADGRTMGIAQLSWNARALHCKGLKTGNSKFCKRWEGLVFISANNLRKMQSVMEWFKGLGKAAINTLRAQSQTS
jgi:hypothetical protein